MVFTEPCPFSSISLNGLRIQVRIGCGEDERRVPQWIRFDVKLRFAQPPQGCLTDQIDETICYAEISDQIREVCHRQEYHLVEKLGWDLFITLKKLFPSPSQLWIRTTKEKPPISDLIEGGASFCVGDWNDSGC